MFKTFIKIKDDLTIIVQGTMFNRMTQQHFLHNITKLNNHFQRKYKWSMKGFETKQIYHGRFVRY